MTESVDLCCILSNAFDNAIAACKHMKDGEVFPKEITADYGIGLSSVKAVVEKYGGTLNLSAEDGFSFSVLLPQSPALKSKFYSH